MREENHTSTTLFVMLSRELILPTNKARLSALQLQSRLPEPCQTLTKFQGLIECFLKIIDVI